MSTSSYVYFLPRWVLNLWSMQMAEKGWIDIEITHNFLITKGKYGKKGMAQPGESGISIFSLKLNI